MLDLLVDSGLKGMFTFSRFSDFWQRVALCCASFIRVTKPDFSTMSFDFDFFLDFVSLVLGFLRNLLHDWQSITLLMDKEYQKLMEFVEKSENWPKFPLLVPYLYEILWSTLFSTTLFVEIFARTNFRVPSDFKNLIYGNTNEKQGYVLRNFYFHMRESV